MAKSKKPLTIVERRLQAGSIFRTGSRPIPLTEPGRWTLREVNSQISDDHVYAMQADKYWTYAEPADLAVAPDTIGFRVQDGRLVKGAQGHIVLMKQAVTDTRAVQQEKDRENRRITFSPKANKAAILAAAQAELGGDEGADFLNRALAETKLVDSRELVRLDE